MDIAWVVGRMAVDYDERSDRIILVVEEVVARGRGRRAGLTRGTRPASRVRLTRARWLAFVEHARELVAAGRPPCRLCGQPIDPEGHVCPRLN